jgi:hypothetical protein
MIANTKYPLRIFGAISQLRYNQEAATSLANSNELPINAIGTIAPGKIASNPMIE